MTWNSTDAAFTLVSCSLGRELDSANVNTHLNSIPQYVEDNDSDNENVTTVVKASNMVQSCPRSVITNTHVLDCISECSKILREFTGEITTKTGCTENKLWTFFY
jgi:hypothetical protein